MALTALSPDYEKHIEYRDAEKNFHGNRVVYVHWEEHLLFCSAIAFPLPPDMPFAAFVEAIVKGHYNAHPDFDKIDWDRVEWMIDGVKVKPDLEQVARRSRRRPQVADPLLDAGP